MVKVLEMKFELLFIRPVFGGPGNWDARASGGHFHDAMIASIFREPYPAIVGENLRPTRQITHRLKDSFPRGLNENRVAGVHLRPTVRARLPAVDSFST
jgi:hypothetical protein